MSASLGMIALVADDYHSAIKHYTYDLGSTLIEDKYGNKWDLIESFGI